MPEFETGLVIGKFSPLHKGHEQVIEIAQKRCSQVILLSWSDPEFDGCDPDTRSSWLRAVFPGCISIVIGSQDASRYGFGHPPANDASDAIQRAYTAQIIEKGNLPVPDAVFTSESYGLGLASSLQDAFARSVSHVSVDPDRTKVPVSGTSIRTDIHQHRSFLSPIVYASFVQSVCFVGAESTGKSTLSQRLADDLQTRRVEEYGRTLWVRRNGKLDFEDYLHIAKTHIAMEEAAKRDANKFIFVDTTPLTTLFYSEEHTGKIDPKLQDLSNREYDFTFLCVPDFPMVQDGWRGEEGFRQAQHDWYLRELKARGIDYIPLTGSFEEKVAKVNAVLAKKTP